MARMVASTSGRSVLNWFLVGFPLLGAVLPYAVGVAVYATVGGGSGERPDLDPMMAAMGVCNAVPFVAVTLLGRGQLSTGAGQALDQLAGADPGRRRSGLGVASHRTVMVGILAPPGRARRRIRRVVRRRGGPPRGDHWERGWGARVERSVERGAMAHSLPAFAGILHVAHRVRSSTPSACCSRACWSDTSAVSSRMAWSGWRRPRRGPGTYPRTGLGRSLEAPTRGSASVLDNRETPADLVAKLS